MPGGTAIVQYIDRFEVPVDGRWHRLELSGGVLMVACRRDDRLDLWAMCSASPVVAREYRVFGSGDPLPEDAEYVGTALAVDGGWAWHLIRRPVRG